MFKCKFCESVTDLICFTPFKNPRRKNELDPAYNFNLKQVCANCHKFQKFLKQTDEQMERLKNNVFMKLDLNPMDRDQL